MMRKRTKIIWLAVALVVLAAALCLGVYGKKMADYKAFVAALTYTEPDLTQLADGVYQGDCDSGVVYAKVAVTVRSGRLEKVDLLEHRQQRGAAADVIVEDIAAQQKIDVDAVSGATCSSQIIKKAVENALNQAPAV